MSVEAGAKGLEAPGIPEARAEHRTRTSTGAESCSGGETRSSAQPSKSSRDILEEESRVTTPLGRLHSGLCCSHAQWQGGLWESPTPGCPQGTGGLQAKKTVFLDAAGRPSADLCPRTFPSPAQPRAPFTSTYTSLHIPFHGPSF